MGAAWAGWLGHCRGVLTGLLFCQAGFEFDRWLDTPGWPPYLPDLSPGDSLMRPAEELAQLWAAEELDPRAINAVSTSAWKTYQLVYFLDKILEKSPLPPGEERPGCWVGGAGQRGVERPHASRAGARRVLSRARRSPLP